MDLRANLLKKIFFYLSLVDKVEHILKLADEYQMRNVFKLCEKALMNEPKSNKNLVTKTLLLAQQYGIEHLRKHCYKQLSEMTLGELRQLDGFQNLDVDSVREVLGQRLEKLETFHRDLYRQFIGIVDCARFLWQESGRPINPCPVHISSVNLRPYDPLQIRIKCPVCKEMLRTMATDYRAARGEKPYPQYHYEEKFTERIVVVLEQMFALVRR